MRGWQQAVSRMAASARIEMISCCLAQQARASGTAVADQVSAAAVVLGGSVRHEAVRGLIGGGLATLATAWRWDEPRRQRALAALRGLVGSPAAFLRSALPGRRVVDEPGRTDSFPHSVVLFGAALAVGWPWATALAVFSSISSGCFCNGGRAFLTTYGLQLSPERLLMGQWHEGHVAPGEECGPPVTIWFDDGGAVFVQCVSSLRASPPVRPAPARGASGLVARPGQPPGQRAATRWFPEYIRMPLDEHGNIVIAKHLLTSVFERHHEWARLIQMDGLTRALVFGLGCYPRKGWRSLASWRPNHPGFDNPVAKLALGHQFVQWLFRRAPRIRAQRLPPAPPHRTPGLRSQEGQGPVPQHYRRPCRE